jgi:hypothetical protein
VIEYYSLDDFERLAETMGMKSLRDNDHGGVAITQY